MRSEGVVDLLKSDGIGDALNSYADQMISKLGSGYKRQDLYTGEKRLNVEVAAVSDEAKKEVLDNNILEKTLRSMES